MHGALILDKQAGITSHTDVLQVRRLLSEPRIGHLGTLDPFATGILVLLLGKATRLARFYKEREKTYIGIIRFGYSTHTYDCTGKPTSAEQNPILDSAEIRRAFAEFTGPQLQQPPPVSAKKVGGVAAYRMVRRGQEPRLEAVPINIHSLELTSVNGALVGFQARVSSGTYIRSLAHELGQRMGCGAHLTQLRRIAVGEFTETEAVTLEELEARVRQASVPLIEMSKLLPEIPAFSLPPAIAHAVSHGNVVTIDSSAKWLRLMDQAGRLKAVAEQIGDALYHPSVVLDCTTNG